MMKARTGLDTRSALVGFRSADEASKVKEEMAKCQSDNEQQSALIKELQE